MLLVIIKCYTCYLLSVVVQLLMIRFTTRIYKEKLSTDPVPQCVRPCVTNEHSSNSLSCKSFIACSVPLLEWEGVLVK